MDAIRSQTFTDWELIIVDDGSTDNTAEVIEQLLANFDRPVRYIRQANQGAYGARNTGLDHVTGRYVAFYDSDDQWLPHHLADCVEALERHPEVDWVFSACKRMEHGTGKMLLENTFYFPDRTPWPFLKLNTQTIGRLKIFDDSRVLECMISGGLNCGLQASVIRSRIFENYRFQTRFRNEAEDQMTVIYALANGYRMAYFDAVHVVYNVHPENSSATASQGVDKRVTIIEAEARGYEELAERGIRLSRNEQRALRKRLFEQYFWQIGYSLLQTHGRTNEAPVMYRRGLKHWPWRLSAWKTYLLALIRSRRAPITIQ